jgi:hypothetical protein
MSEFTSDVQHLDFGVGATGELSLRVSVATLVRVVFENPQHGDLMLALEHKATLVAGEGEPRVMVKAQPFGGAIRFLNLAPLQTLIGNFHFDSERSRSEQDFRIFIRPADWDTVKEFCLWYFRQENDLVLESDPARELVEEFADALDIELRPEQYVTQPLRSVVENEPVRTRNVHAQGYPTTRIYRVFETRIVDPALCRAMIANSQNRSSQDLRELALKDAREGGKGRANAMLVLPLQLIRDVYLAMSPETRNRPITFEGSHLEGNVLAVLEGVAVPKYRSWGASDGGIFKPD